MALPALDHRFGWSPVATVVSIIDDALIVLSFVLFFWVMKSNSYAASTIQVEEGQPVVSTGPYAYVRHAVASISASPAHWRIRLRTLKAGHMNFAGIFPALLAGARYARLLASVGFCGCFRGVVADDGALFPHARPKAR